MKVLQSGVMVACVALVLALLLGMLALGGFDQVGKVAQAAPRAQENALVELTPAGAADVQVARVVVTATVGTVSGACATTTTAYVRANTTVYYCYRVQNIGDEVLTVHRLQTSRGEIDRNLASFELDPGEIRQVVQINSEPFLTDTTSVDVTNFVTWTATTSGGTQAVDTTRAMIDIVNPALQVTKSVGQDRTICPTAQTVRVPSGESVAFCISLRNTGDITFTRHTVVDASLGINASFNYTLTPNDTLNIIPTNLATLGITNGTLERANVTTGFTNDATVTSTGGTGLSVSGVASATVEIGTTTVRFAKTVSREPESCNGTNSITVDPGTMVYYCVTIENTGAFTLTQHSLTEQFLSIDVEFDYVLRPGETLRVTNDFLRGIDQPVVFGPFELAPRFGPVINNSMSYVGTSPDGFSVNASAGTTGSIIPTPTATRTSPPDPTRTPTPAPTSTPTPTFTPTPVTPSPTPTDTPVTPSPTPTTSYAITLLETPTPRSQVPGVPQNPPQNPTPLPGDPNQSPLPTPDPQLAGQDPVLATATQIAVNATLTAVAGATVTAESVVAEATAAQIAVENAQATALAEAQGPDSPLPTVAATLTLVPVDSPLPTPTGTPAMLPTVMPTVTPQGGVAVTVLPPVETVVIEPVVGTPTPAVVMLVVTNTPEGGQRPIVYPTPTATPDLVLAAARSVDAAVMTFGWLWFLVGSLVFFVTAGIMAGLFFRQSEVSRYDLPEPEYWLEDEAVAGAGRDRRDRAGQDDDEWPDDLP